MIDRVREYAIWDGDEGGGQEKTMGGDTYIQGSSD